MSPLNLYNQLQSPTTQLDEKFYIAASEKTRMDPRLAEILIERLQQDWPKLNPMLLRELNFKSRQPQVLAVLMEHVLLIEESTQIKSRPPFTHFMQLVTHGIKPAPYQSFTLGLLKVGGQQQFHKAQFPHPLFAKWGFYENDLFLKKQTHTKTTLDAKTRRRILKNLIEKQKEFKVADYILACRGAIHKRQAERDLKTFFKLKTRGRTRGKIYSKRSSAQSGK